MASSFDSAGGADLTPVHVTAVTAGMLLCDACGRRLEERVSFCAGCGAAAGAQRAKRGYRGPRRMAIAGVLLTLPAGAVAFALATTVLASGAPSFLVDIAGPVVNVGLEAAGEEKLDVGDGGASFAIVGGFVASVLVATFGACLLFFSVLWSIARFAPRRRSRRAYERARPTGERLGRTGRAGAVAASEAGRVQARRARSVLERRRQRSSPQPVLEAAPELDMTGVAVPADERRAV